MSAKLEMLTFDEGLRRELDELVAEITGVSFPSARWRDDPVAFCREVLGIEPWSRQVELLEAVRDHDRVAAKSGNKIGKSFAVSALALWYYCSFYDARVMMTSTTAYQIDDVLWREIQKLRARAGLCVDCKAEDQERAERRARGEEAPPLDRPCIHSALIDGKMGSLARTGLKSDDFREIRGRTAKDKEAMQGFSGQNLLYIVDEASGIADEIFDGMEGNRAAGAKIVMIGNPTRTTGVFFDAFHSKADLYSTHTISSEETPNALYGADDPRAIPGLANKRKLEEWKEEWGEDSEFYLVRVRGQFALAEDGKLFSIHRITEAQQRLEEMLAYWEANEDERNEERLYIGLDPAGDGPSGDETVWAPRRGLQAFDLRAIRGISKGEILRRTVELCQELAHEDRHEVPVVVFDAEGKIGAELLGEFNAFLERCDEVPFQVVPIRASDKAHRQSHIYDRMRDELAAVLLDWVKKGGAIPDDPKLAKEMHLWEMERKIDGRWKLTPDKKGARKELRRSPDRYDALALSVWEPMSTRGNRPPRKTTMDPDPVSTRPDPYGAPAVDPYG